MTKNGFDCATKLTAASAKALKALGFDYVVRYLGDSWKTFDKVEAKAIQDAKLNLISVYEENSTFLGYFNRAQGIEDAKEAYKYAKAIGQPSGSAIYFTVDYDAQASHMGAILAYLDGVKDALKDYKVGLYGSYDVMNAVKGKVDFYWQTYAWSDGKVADHIHMHQYQNNVTVGGVALDRNDIKKDPGHWVEVKAAPKTKPATVKKESNDDYLYIVKSGDTLTDIAADKGVSVDYLVKLNKISNKDKIFAGQRLKLKGKVQETKPAAQVKTYTIQKGDNFWELENKWKMKHGTLQKLNPKVNPDKLQIGQKIRVK
jgi:LysM repeat protein